MVACTFLVLGLPIAAHNLLWCSLALTCTWRALGDICSTTIGQSLTLSPSVSSKEQKQILADIQSGSQKFGRRLTRPSQKRERSGDLLVPVTVTGEAAEQQERRGRKSTSSQRPGLPKRTNSMKRAYNYFFGGGQPVPVPPSPTAPVTTTDTTAPSKIEEAPRDNGIDTPPDTPHEASIPGGEDRIGMYCSFTPSNSQ